MCYWKDKVGTHLPAAKCERFRTLIYALGRNQCAVGQQGDVRLLMSKSIASMRINDYRQKMQKGQVTDPEQLKASQSSLAFPGFPTFHVLVCREKRWMKRFGHLLALVGQR